MGHWLKADNFSSQWPEGAGKRIHPMVESQRRRSNITSSGEADHRGV